MVLRLSICELYRAGRFPFPPKYLVQPSIIELPYLLALCFSLATLSLVLALVLSLIVTAGSVRTRHSGEWHVKGGVIGESTDSTWKALEAPLGFES